ncbi:MAG TPA: FAD-dependent oxidoreductase [Longimicrobiales bacterium]|nr:FAD-dependent oxidoreductase [Longimicrobiales bacterium]
MSSPDPDGLQHARAGGRPRQREKTPPCSCGCPNGTDVRGWIGVIAQREKNGLSLDEAYVQAWNKLTDVNPFPSVLGRICPHPCQDSCNRGPMDGSLEVRALERFLGDKGLEMNLPLGRREAPPVVASIGIVGSGPAGLSCAYQLARRGHRVTVYERAPMAGGMLRYGIPDYRLPPAILDAEIERIVSLGVEIRVNTAVGRDVTVDAIHRSHDAIFVGIGAQLGQALRIPGEDGPGVWTGTDYLRAVNQGQRADTGRRVIVVGGGNTAVDACRTARRGGSDVVLLYRRGRDEMPAYADEVDAMIAEGVRVEFLTAPVAIQRSGARVTGVLAQLMKLGDVDESGRRRPEPIQGATFQIPADSVIAAVSQGPDWHDIESINPGGGWIDVDGSGAIAEDVWVGGDIRGLGFASLAIAQGRRAAEEIHARVCGLEVPPQRDPSDQEGPPVNRDFYPPRRPPKPRELPPTSALARPDAEVTATLLEEQFLAELDNCLSCGQCFGCQHCWMYCSSGGFSRVVESEPGRYFTISLDSCESCGKCVDVCPCGFLEFNA